MSEVTLYVARGEGGRESTGGVLGGVGAGLPLLEQRFGVVAEHVLG